MQLLPLNRLGARESAVGVVDFGLLLPWVSAKDGNRLWVKVIHEKDQFLKEIQPVEFEMTHSLDPVYGDYWSTQITVKPADRPHLKSAWGEPGRYVYRYLLKNPNAVGTIDWIIDPFAREYGVGKLSAITLGYQQHQWSPKELVWKTPALNDLIMYELMINEFGGDIPGTIAKLEYLSDLGINCIELMPVANVSNTIDWGYMPIGHFGVDERFGHRKDLQLLIDEAHQRGIAVVLDSVYAHVSDSFAYAYVYKRLQYDSNPFVGPFARDDFGTGTDFHREFTRDFFLTVNHHWLDCYHVDGFRYDYVPGYWDGPLGDGYAGLTYETHRLVKSKEGATDHWQRFFNDGGINLIQCAEYLDGPVDILNCTYSNCTWQNWTLDAAKATARQSAADLENLGFRLGLMGYPQSVVHNSVDTLRKTALQYIENHDHERFVCNYGTEQRGNELLGEGDRARWPKVQPYLIGMFTAKGIPMLWQGQEFGENYFVPDQGWGRVMLFRPVRWDYFYDEIGKAVISLVRRLATLRRTLPQFRSGDHYFHNHYEHYQSKGVLLFSRRLGEDFSLVALNFGNEDQTVPFGFEASGSYREELHGREEDHLNVPDAQSGETRWLIVPSNYGRIWTRVP